VTQRSIPSLYSLSRRRGQTSRGSKRVCLKRTTATSVR
jgi:hypothetical protein